MSPTVTKKPQAIGDLENIFVYIGDSNMEAAQRFLLAAENTFQKLASMPLMGRSRDEFTDPRLAGLRSKQILEFENYIVFYRPVDTGVEIIRVLHGARDLESVLRTE